MNQPDVRTAVLLSGAGSTLQHLINLQHSRLPIDIRLVISSKRDAGGMERARAAGIEAVCIPRRSYQDTASFSASVNSLLERYEVDLVLMAGLIHLWQIPDHLQGRVLNVHPSLIPSFCGNGFYDLRVHEAVVASGVKLTGCTVHFADEAYDHGPIILQRSVAIAFTDTAHDVRAKVQELERQAYPEAIQLFCDGRLRIVGQRVEILEQPQHE
jgi:formyltetrahydrofolate-dependent phosphoribosylglycinamide formyltransferase